MRDADKELEPALHGRRIDGDKGVVIQALTGDVDDGGPRNPPHAASSSIESGF
jgi:hypothetical protein